MMPSSTARSILMLSFYARRFNFLLKQIPLPDFEIVRQEIDAQYLVQNNWSPDTLSEVVRQLTDFKIFANNDDAAIWHSLTDRTVVIDLHGLTVLREMTVFLVLHSLYRELMAMPDSNVADGVREMRTIIVKDASASFFERQKAQCNFGKID